jgi:4,5-DOPA dioxygenase extradiol
MQQKKMPVLFVGHGSPMNAIENNIHTESWRKIGEEIQRPKAIILFSAHWITEWYTAISSAKNLEMIYDMYGFPPELYKVQYPAEGDLELAERIASVIARNEAIQSSVLQKPGLPRQSRAPSSQWQEQYYDALAWSKKNKRWNVELDPTRGLDHGEWSVLRHMFPEADIPVVSISLDYRLTRASFLDIGRALASLREEWVLIIWSGNIVHNLRAIDWSNSMIHPWARDFDSKIEENILSRNFANIVDFESWKDTKNAHPTVDHILPLLPLLGAISSWDIPVFYTPDITMGSLSMRSILWNSEK